MGADSDEATTWTTEESSFDSRYGRQFFCYLETGSGAHTAFYSMGNGSVLPGLKRPGLKVDHSYPSNA